MNLLIPSQIVNAPVSINVYIVTISSCTQIFYIISLGPFHTCVYTVIPSKTGIYVNGELHCACRSRHNEIQDPCHIFQVGGQDMRSLIKLDTGQHKPGTEVAHQNPPPDDVNHLPGVVRQPLHENTECMKEHMIDTTCMHMHKDKLYKPVYIWQYSRQSGATIVSQECMKYWIH